MTHTPEQVATAAHAEWHPAQTAPTMTKCLLFTENGVAVIGHWAPAGYLAWAPLPKQPGWLRQLLAETRKSYRGR